MSGATVTATDAEMDGAREVLDAVLYSWGRSEVTPAVLGLHSLVAKMQRAHAAEAVRAIQGLYRESDT